MRFFNAVAASCLFFAQKQPSVKAETPLFLNDMDEAIEAFREYTLADDGEYMDLLKKKRTLQKNCCDNSLPDISQVESCKAAHLMFDWFSAFEGVASENLGLVLALELEKLKKQKPDIYERLSLSSTSLLKYSPKSEHLLEGEAKSTEEEPIWFKWMKGEIEDDEVSEEEAAFTESYQF